MQTKGLPKRKPSNRMYCITRMDYTRPKRDRGGTHGWWVRISRQEVVHSKFFSDGVYGGKALALAAAQTFRDDLLEKLGPPSKQIGRRHYERPNPGIMKLKTFRYRGHDGDWYEFRAWHAWIRISPTKIVATKWSVEKWGTIGAKQRIEQWLKEQQMIQATNYKILRRRHFRSIAQGEK